MKQEICKTQDVPPVGSQVFPFFGREVQVWRTGDKIRAAANVCLHFGGPLERKNGELVCPWHGARFDMQNGQQIDGPGAANARLIFFPTRVEDDALIYVWDEP